MKLVTAEQMRELDRIAIRERGIPSMELMERAGAAVARCAASMIADGGLRRRALLFVGKGNNGGDAFVAARHLEAEGIKTKTILLSGRREITGDARENLQRLEQTGADLVRAETLEELEGLRECAGAFDLVIDGILGTGVKGNVSGHFAEAIFFICGLHEMVVAIDVPSGLDATSGRACGVAVRASATVTMGLPKIGLVRADGLEHSGRIRVADIGLPEDSVRDVPGEGELTVEQDLYNLFPPRRRVSHKGDYGRILIVAGSPGMTGAACLAASAAMRAGSGLVTVAAPRSLNPILEVKLTEAMTLPLPETAAGTLGREAGEEILRVADRFDIAVIGPGLSRHQETVQMVRTLAANLRTPMLIDADGLNALAEDASVLKKMESQVILTPHPGEMARLLKRDTAAILNDRLAAAEGFARDYGITLALKGALTVVATAAGGLSLNASGNPGMASGGSGDVLSGVIASFWGQGMSAPDAARAGVFVHGDAGDRAALLLGERALIASDIIDHLPAAIESLAHRRW
ncbi:MAG: NAD(P)H-hydrate dehydratase [Candidatus Aureabacteria bacterium]|nr:NAD(P)H-hydrate dehydratase [Candidatus Auribacterota bacterium]